MFLLSLFLASVSPAPQWDGLKSLVKNLSGDDQPGEVNGDYEQVPYEVLAKLNVSLSCQRVEKIILELCWNSIAGIRGEEVPERDVRLHRDDLRHPRR